jgi:hypothetical protein
MTVQIVAVPDKEAGFAKGNCFIDVGFREGKS